MQENSVSKGEKTPSTRVRRCLCFLLPFLVVGILTFIIYNSSTEVLWPSNILRTSLMSFQPYDNRTAVGSMANNQPTTDHPESQYFVAYPHQYHFIVDEPNRCQQESPFLVLMIPVAPHNREARDIIRNTWGKETTILGQVISHYFLLGLSKEGDGTELLKEQVLQESQRHQDILQSSFVDSYNNLTIKTMVMFEWLNSHCPNTSYAMKVDSDIFLNVRNLVDMLLKAPHHLYMTGLVARNAAVLRDHNSKWFLPVSAFAESTYPPYALGLGYVFSLDLPKKILEASLHVRAIYIEDVYVGLCMKHQGIPLTNPPGGLFMATSQTFSSCYWTSVITTLLQDSKQLLDVWRIYQTHAQSGC